MSYKTTHIPRQFAGRVSAALQTEGWSVSREDLLRDGFLINHVAEEEIEQAVSIAKDAIASSMAYSLADEDEIRAKL